MAEQIRQAIERQGVHLDAARISYTVSIGVRHGGDGILSFSQLMLEADRALYRARRRAATVFAAASWRAEQASCRCPDSHLGGGV